VVVIVTADNQDASMMMLLMLFVIIAIPVENHNPAMISISIPISVPVVLSLAHADRYMAFFRHNDGLFCRRGPRDYRGAQKCKRANDETKPLHVMFPLLGHLKTGIALGGGVTMNARIDVLFPTVSFDQSRANGILVLSGALAALALWEWIRQIRSLRYRLVR
jgi:hypothetical protein